MSVLALVFHQVHQEGTTRNKERFESYLAYLKDHFPIILPGEPHIHPLSICLTFDDAYADFYEVVFPLLKKWNIKALLAVPTKYISNTREENTSILAPHISPQEDTFCTWAELQEIVDSGLVEIASHSHTHPRLELNKIDCHQELVHSKQLLENKLQISVQNFVYPYGYASPAMQAFVSQHYRYSHRVGGAINPQWPARDKVIYRVNADPFWIPDTPWKNFNIPYYKIRFLWKEWLQPYKKVLGL